MANSKTFTGATQAAHVTQREGLFWWKQKKKPDLGSAADELIRLQDKLKEYPALGSLRDGQAREFNRTLADVGLQKKQLGGSLASLWHNVQTKVFRIDVAKVGSKSVPKDIAATVEKVASSSKAGLIERVLSKPIRIAAHHPRAAAIVGAFAAFAGISSWLSNRDAQRTQDQMMADMAMAQQAQNAAMSNQYMNSVSPQEAAMLEARMRGGDSRGSFASGIQTARQGAMPNQAQ